MEKMMQHIPEFRYPQSEDAQFIARLFDTLSSVPQDFRFPDDVEADCTLEAQRLAEYVTSRWDIARYRPALDVAEKGIISYAVNTAKARIAVLPELDEDVMSKIHGDMLLFARKFIGTIHMADGIIHDTNPEHAKLQRMYTNLLREQASEQQTTEEKVIYTMYLDPSDYENPEEPSQQITRTRSRMVRRK